MPDFLAGDEEETLLAFIRTLEFKEFVMHGMPARRRIAHFGFVYSFDSRHLSAASPIPEPLLALRDRVGAQLGIPAERFQEALATEYRPGADRAGAGIGWHRDAPPFGVIAGISLASASTMRLRPRSDHSRVVKIELPARSLYALDGAARSDWEHMIPPVKSQRYSITYRTLKQKIELK